MSFPHALSGNPQKQNGFPLKTCGNDSPLFAVYRARMYWAKR